MPNKEDITLIWHIGSQLGIVLVMHGIRNLQLRWEKFHFKMSIGLLRDGFKTQPAVDRRFHPVPRGYCCSKQWQPPRTGWNRWSTAGWVLKPPLMWMALHQQLSSLEFNNIKFETENVNSNLWRPYERNTEVLTKNNCEYKMQIITTFIPVGLSSDLESSITKWESE